VTFHGVSTLCFGYSLGVLDKQSIRAALLERLRADLDKVTASQHETQAGAVHEEARPESDKDTRATESSYLARGLAKRVEELRASVGQLSNLALRSFGDDDVVGLSALVTVERESGEQAHYFLAPCAGGVKVAVDGVQVTALSSSSPLGQALLGKRVDDEVETRTPQGTTSLVIVELC
jgi:transcription elongation GreA/GreB family factor